MKDETVDLENSARTNILEEQIKLLWKFIKEEY